MHTVTCIHTYINTCMHTYIMHTYIHTYMYTYIYEHTITYKQLIYIPCAPLFDYIEYGNTIQIEKYRFSDIRS